ncbi:hypothetical protein [Acinetobacter boissieri]|uniref:Tetratricopeptide repeat-containing protein n=1 Tax=Acinetobacter boissieri TaxID=1219383 RepID=A0A1G6H4K8_9GAMM|nr:hypothetical protein [Acinetobacter boissieri]SDB88356.1 hypothetical protein SAMN05421733_103191 [Acinetobacter boissieri]
MGAFRDFKNTIRDLDKNIQSLFEQANSAITRQQFDHAKILLEQIKQQQPKDARWMHGLGNLHHYQGETTLAYHYYMQAAQLKFAIAFDHLGQIESERHNHILSEHYFLSAIQYGHHSSLIPLGKILLNQYRIEDAMGCFYQALEHHNNEAFIPLAQCYLLRKQYDLAQDTLTQALDLDLPNTSHYIAQMYQQQNYLDDAKNWYLHSFQTDKNISSLEQFGQILCAQEQLIQGEKIIQLAQKIEDEYTLSKEDEQLINIILGTGSTFQIT